MYQYTNVQISLREICYWGGEVLEKTCLISRSYAALIRLSFFSALLPKPLLSLTSKGEGSAEVRVRNRGRVAHVQRESATEPATAVIAAAKGVRCCRTISCPICIITIIYRLGCICC